MRYTSMTFHGTAKKRQSLGCLHLVQLRLAQFFLGESVQVAPASTCTSVFSNYLST